LAVIFILLLQGVLVGLGFISHVDQAREHVLLVWIDPVFRAAKQVDGVKPLLDRSRFKPDRFQNARRSSGQDFRDQDIRERVPERGLARQMVEPDGQVVLRLVRRLRVFGPNRQDISSPGAAVPAS
jgi:hypothetical protein